MTAGEVVSLLINGGVGLYFARIYPPQVQRRFPGHVPPLFAVLVKVLRPVGWLLMGGSAVYALARLAGG
jgi:hypothetical protein